MTPDVLIAHIEDIQGMVRSVVMQFFRQLLLQKIEHFFLKPVVLTHSTMSSSKPYDPQTDQQQYKNETYPKIFNRVVNGLELLVNDLALNMNLVTQLPT